MKLCSEPGCLRPSMRQTGDFRWWCMGHPLSVIAPQPAPGDLAKAKPAATPRARKVVAAPPAPGARCGCGREAAHPGRCLLPIPVADLVAAYRAGATLTALAAAHGTTIATVKQRLTQAGERVATKSHNRVALDIEVVHQLRRLGWTNAKIARHFGCSPQKIYRLLRAHRAAS